MLLLIPSAPAARRGCLSLATRHRASRVGWAMNRSLSALFAVWPSGSPSLCNNRGTPICLLALCVPSAVSDAWYPSCRVSCPLQASEQVDMLVSMHEGRHRQHCIQRWRDKVTASPESTLMWIKHRADQEIRLNSAPPLQDVTQCPVHPADRVTQQGEAWTRRWQTPIRRLTQVILLASCSDCRANHSPGPRAEPG